MLSVLGVVHVVHRFTPIFAEITTLLVELSQLEFTAHPRFIESVGGSTGLRVRSYQKALDRCTSVKFTRF